MPFELHGAHFLALFLFCVFLCVRLLSAWYSASLSHHSTTILWNPTVQPPGRGWGGHGVLLHTASTSLIHEMTQAKQLFVLVAGSHTSRPWRRLAATIIRGKFTQVMSLPGRRTMGCGTLRPTLTWRRLKVDTIWVSGWHVATGN